MEQDSQQNTGDPASPSRAHEQSPQAVSALRVSPAIAQHDASVALVRDIAMDIGKEVAAHIETMYPAAVTATTRNMLLSVRNCVFNEIIAAIQVSDEGMILRRLERRKSHRRKMKAVYRTIRAQGIDARSGETAGLDPKGESPVGNADAPKENDHG